MKTIKKIFAGFFLIIGLSILLIGTIELVNPNSTKKDKEGGLAAIVVFSLPSTAIATWLIWSLKQDYRQKVKQIETAKEQVFLQLLQETEGKITITKFALSANISIEEAKEYLDIKSQQLNGDFEASDEGGIIYKFPH
jgi:predicted transcriptional regulator